MTRWLFVPYASGMTVLCYWLSELIVPALGGRFYSRIALEDVAFYSAQSAFFVIMLQWGWPFKHEAKTDPSEGNP